MPLREQSKPPEIVPFKRVSDYFVKGERSEYTISKSEGLQLLETEFALETDTVCVSL